MYQEGGQFNSFAGMMPYTQVDHKWTSNWMKTGPDQNENNQNGEVRISVETLENLEKAEAPGAEGDYSKVIHVLTIPFIGRIHFLQQKLGIIMISIVITYWIYGYWCTMYVLLKPHYDEGHISAFQFFYYSAVSFCTIFSLFRASLSNPGRIPFSSSTPVPLEHMSSNHCEICMRRKPLRAHHCSKCQQCVLRMDHHCPWINNCVGEGNHWMFVQLLFYAFMMGMTAFVYCMLHFFYWPACDSCPQERFLCYHIEAFAKFGVVLCCLIMVGTFGLIFTQMVGAVRDMTTIDWMKLNKERMQGTFDPSKIPKPSKTCTKALEDLCGPGLRIMWLLPCRKRKGPLQIKYQEIV